MKIRNGFVSNSSSSSFIIIGEPVVSANTLTKKDIKNGVWAIGDYLGAGKDVFKINNEMLKLIKKFNFDFQLFKNSDMFIDYPTIVENMVGKEIHSGEKDNYSSYNIELFMERYCNMEE